ncbi:MAG TPA: hypothetical protein VME22_25545 [Solirubrobacteraceae bacterium]|nr:hypothetical protein [Solirubrobacteraceae bacterium]
MIVRRLIAAWRGRAVWRRLRKSYDIDNGGYVIACIEDDQALNEVALAHVQDLIADRRARGVVVVTDQAWVAERAGKETDGVLAVEIVGDREIEHLLSFYELYQFTPRLFFVSLTRPTENRLWRMVDVNGLTLDDLVCLSMYRIRGWGGHGVSCA